MTEPTIAKVTFPKTQDGNDPADHKGDPKLEFQIKRLVECAADEQRLSQEQAKEFDAFKPRKIPEDLMIKEAAARPRLIGNFLYRNAITLLGGVGGVGKSVLMLTIGISKAIGRDLAGISPEHEIKPGKVLILNNEDDFPEIELRLKAIIQHYDVSEEEFSLLRRNFLYESGLHQKLRLSATDPHSKAIMPTHILGEIRNYCSLSGTEVLMADPLVSLHDVEENNNSHMEEVMSHLRDMICKAGMGMVLAHHSPKGSSTSSADEQLRGASAIVAAARVVKVLCRMPDKEKTNWNIDPEARRQHVYLADGKANYHPPSDSVAWMRLFSVEVEALNEDNSSTTEFIGVPAPISLQPTTEDKTEGVLPDTDRAEVVALLHKEAWPLKVTNHYRALLKLFNVDTEKSVRTRLECFPLVEPSEEIEDKAEIVFSEFGQFIVWREKKNNSTGIVLHREKIDPSKPSLEVRKSSGSTALPNQCSQGLDSV